MVSGGAADASEDVEGAGAVAISVSMDGCTGRDGEWVGEGEMFRWFRGRNVPDEWWNVPPI